MRQEDTPTWAEMKKELEKFGFEKKAKDELFKKLNPDETIWCYESCIFVEVKGSFYKAPHIATIPIIESHYKHITGKELVLVKKKEVVYNHAYACEVIRGLDKVFCVARSTGIVEKQPLECSFYHQTLPTENLAEKIKLIIELVKIAWVCNQACEADGERWAILDRAYKNKVTYDIATVNPKYTCSKPVLFNSKQAAELFLKHNEKDYRRYLELNNQF